MRHADTYPVLLVTLFNLCRNEKAPQGGTGRWGAWWVSPGKCHQAKVTNQPQALTLEFIQR